MFQCQSPLHQEILKVASPHSSARIAADETLPVSGYDLRYQDLFDKSTLNRNDWFYRTGPRYGGINDPKQVVVKDNKLNINYDYDPTTRQYRAGGIISTHTFGYGYYEVTAKLYTDTPGLHQSFWTMGLDLNDPALSGYYLVNKDMLPIYNQVLEIDGFEQNSNSGRLASNNHASLPTHSQSVEQIVYPNPRSNWFKMGFEWTNTQINYFYNGKLVAHKDTRPGKWRNYSPQNLWLTALATPDSPFPTWGVATPPTKNAGMQISSFKYYTKKRVGLNLIANPGFEYLKSNASIEESTYPTCWIEARNYDLDPTKSIVKTDAEVAYLGKRYLLHEAEKGLYKATTKQNLDYIAPGRYNLSAWVRSSGGQKVARMRVIVGGKERYYNIPASSKWIQVSIDNVTVDSDDITVAFTSETDAPYQWLAIDSVTFAANR